MPAKYRVFYEAHDRSKRYFCGYRNVAGAWNTSARAEDALPVVLHKAQAIAQKADGITGGQASIEEVETSSKTLKALRARCAELEGERDAATNRAREARETAENYLGHCDAACKKLETVEAERDNAVRYTELLIQERDAAKADLEKLIGELAAEEDNCPYPDFSCGTFAVERGIELRPAGGPTYTTTIEHWQGILRERDEAQAKLREIGMAICCVNDFEGFDPLQLVKDQMAQYQADLDAAKAEAKKSKAVTNEIRDELRLTNQIESITEEQLTLARAGEARVVEALAKLTAGQWRASLHNQFDSSECRIWGSFETELQAMAVATQEAKDSTDTATTPSAVFERLLSGKESLAVVSALDTHPALDWLAQVKREAAEAERRANTDAVRSMGPHFCDFFFGGPGEAEYLEQQLAAACREAAAEELEELRHRWLMDPEYATGNSEIWRCANDRAAALRAGEGQDAE